MSWVIVTGASSGIGRSTAIYFSNKGYNLILLGRDRKRLLETQSHLKTPSKIFGLDFENIKNSNSTIEEIKTFLKSEKLFSLIHNAGSISRLPFEQTNLDHWNQCFQVHIIGPAHLTIYLIDLIKRDSASIVNVSSNLGIKPIINTSAYSASKAAMLNWTQSLALELAPWKVRVNAVAPGIVQTPIHGQWSPEMLEQMNNLQPLKRVATPEEIAKSIYFLASDDSSWTTGTTLVVDGGISLL